MRVRLLPADAAGCAHYRHEEPARVAAEHGVEVVVHHENFAIYQGPSGRFVGDCVEDPQQAREWDEDVVVLQRPAKDTTVMMIEVLQSRGVAVVVDVDDDFSCLHPQHPARDAFNPNLNSEVNWRHLQRACALADLVTVTTPALADRYGAHGRFAILPNCVPARLLEMPRSSDGHTLGWTGAKHMHPGDLEVTHAGVAMALERTGWRFRVVGKPEGVGEALGIGPAEGTDWLDIDGWYDELGSLDVGIVPLCDSKFNDGKSALKGLELAARGVPFVASETPEYLTLAAEGVGVLAPERGRNWKAQLVALMIDESLRCEKADQARQAVAEHHTYETEGWRWVEAWAAAATRTVAA